MRIGAPKFAVWFNLRQRATFFVFFLLLVLTPVALFCPIVSSDSTWYHLPFSKIIWHINGFTARDLDYFIYQRYLGFPQFAEAIQGFFWWLTGRQSFVTVPHLVLFALYVWMVARYLRLPVFLLILALFACPMLLIHYFDTYIDLFCGLALAIAFFGAMSALRRLSRPDFFLRHEDYGCAAIALVMAANSKYYTYFPALLLLGMVLVQVIAARGVDSKLKLKAATLIVILSIFCSTYEIRNLARLHDPFYPVIVSVQDHVIFPGTEPAYETAPQYSKAIMNFQPLRFFLSASEIDWSWRGIPTAYSVDETNGDAPRRDHPARTGGWGGLYFLLLLAIAGFGLRHGRARAGSLLRLCLVNFFIFTFLSTFLPQSYVLRFYIYIPLILIPLALKLCLVNRSTLGAAKLVLVLMLFFHLCYFHLGTGLAGKHPSGDSRAEAAASCRGVTI